MIVEIEPFTVGQLVHRLNSEPDFSFARYGDGTFMSLNGMEGVNCDGAATTIKQAEELERSIRDETIAHGLGDLALSVGKADEWLWRKQIKLRWLDANVLNTATQKGLLSPFIKWLRGQKIVMLGPPHLVGFPAFAVAQFIPVHPTAAFEQRQRLESLAERAIMEQKATTVLISAGPCAPGLVSRLHRSDRALHVLDVGSIWDPFVGVFSRRWQQKSSWGRLKQLGLENFGQEIERWRLPVPS